MNLEKKKNINVVLDTNVFISSIFWTGNPHRIVELALDKTIQVYTSLEILTELERVLKNSFKQDTQFIERQIALILEYALVIQTNQRVEIIKEDQDDNKIIECALAAKADYIISGDHHLFDLKEIFEIRIVKPKEFLEEINNSIS